MNGRPGGPAAPPPRAAAEPPAAGGGGKRQRTEPLAGVTIFVPKQGLPHSTQIFKVWSKSVPSLGGAVTQDERCPAVTHVLIPQPAPPAAKSGGLGSGSGSGGSSSPTVACQRSGWDSVPACLHPGTATAPSVLAYVTPQWLTDCLRLQRRQPESNYRPPTQEEEAAAVASAAAAAGGGAGGAGGWGSDEEGEPAVKDLEAWLGPLWRAECAAMGRVELTLQVGGPTPTPITAPPPPPPGPPANISLASADTSSVPAHMQPVVLSLSNLYKVCEQGAGAHPGKRREVEDSSKKLGALFWRMNRGEVSQSVAGKLLQLCQALDAGDFVTATHLQVSLTTSDWDECSPWLTALKRLIKARHQLMG